MLSEKHDQKMKDYEAHKCQYDEFMLCFECDKKASAGEYAKAHGMTLEDISLTIGKDRKTIYNWWKNSPTLFVAVIKGLELLR